MLGYPKTDNGKTIMSNTHTTVKYVLRTPIPKIEKIKDQTLFFNQMQNNFVT